MSASTKATPQEIKEVFSKARDVLVMLPMNPSWDTVAAGLALYQSLSKKDTHVYVACPSPLESQTAPIEGVEAITDKIGNRNLVIALKVDSRESIDKVSYNLDEAAKVFNLVIQPKKGNPPLKANDIEYSYVGVQADVVVMVGVNRLEDLGVFYQEEAKLFTEATTIRIHRYQSQKIAMHEFVESKLGSVSEVTWKFLQEAGLSVDSKVATYLLNGVELATNNLQGPAISPETFEAIAALMRLGGKRQVTTPQPQEGRNGTHGGVQVMGNGAPQDWMQPRS